MAHARISSPVRIACLLLFLTSAAPFEASAAPAQVQVSAPSPSSFVWVAHRDGVVKVMAADGSRAVTISGLEDVQGLALDPQRQAAWVLVRRTLFRYDLQGNRLFGFTLPHPLGAKASLALYASDGSVWIGSGKDLWSVSAAGQLLVQVRLTRDVVDLAVDSGRRVLWVGSERGLETRDAISGSRLRSLTIQGIDPLVALTVERPGRVGLGLLLELRRMDETGSVGSRFPVLALRDLAAGPRGTWVIGELEVRLFGESGPSASYLLPLLRYGGARRVASDPLTGSAWVASEREIAFLPAGGGAVQRFDPHLPSPIVDLAVEADLSPPSLEILAPAAGTIVASRSPLFRLRFEDLGTGIDPASFAAKVQGAPRPSSCGPPAGNTVECTLTAPLAEGAQLVEWTVADRAGNRSAPASVAFTVDTLAPSAIDATRITVSAPSGGQVAVSGSAGAAEGGARISVTNGRTGEIREVVATSDGRFAVEIAGQAGDTLTLTAIDAAGNRGPAISMVVPGTADPTLPPDPATIAPPLDRTVATDLYAATKFLIEGPNPVQVGVQVGAIDPVRVAVLRGRVLDRAASPLSGVRVTVLGHPELGSTLSRGDGWFDLVVNGGGGLTLQFERAGYLTTQRGTQAPWRDYHPLKDVVLLARDTAAATIVSGAPQLQVARGSVSEDGDGRRRATLLIPPGLAAERVRPDGTSEPLASFTFRATEYTLGAEGPRAMPGDLPPSVAYTYAVELAADEVADDSEVRFNTPAYLYVENFIGFPVGSVVPAGSYRRREGRWQGEADGRVVRVLGVGEDGRALLDVDGSGIPTEEARLAQLGVTSAELEGLASLYPAGATLWRTPIPHLTPWDCNWPFAPPADAEAPPPDSDEGEDSNDPNDPNDDPDPRHHHDPSDPNDPSNQDSSQDEDRPDSECGSIVDCHNQILGEAVPLAGTGESLHYASDRVPGRNANYYLKIQVTGATVPAGLKRVDLEIALAGQVIRRSFPPLPKQVFTYLWDGLDVYGRAVQGKQTVTIRKGYTYPLVYMRPGDFQVAWERFGVFEPFAVPLPRDYSEVTFWRTRQGPIDGLAQRLGGWDSRELGLGGWSLSSHHVYDPNGRSLYLGTGERRTARQLGPVIVPAAGIGEHGDSGDGGRAVLARLAIPGDVAVAPDGTAYIADTGNHIVRRVDRDGTITRVAGTPGERCVTDRNEGTIGEPCGGGGPALAAHLYEPEGLAIGPDGTLYIADTRDNCIRQLHNGRLETVAGHCSGFDPNGPTSFAPERSPLKDLTDCLSGCDARTELDLDRPADLAVAPDGGLYITDTRNSRIVYVSPSRRAWPIAGLGPAGLDTGDGGPALDASLSFPSGIALGTNGEIYVSDSGNHRVRRIGRDGIIATLAGIGIAGFFGDGGPGAEAQISSPAHLAVGRDGTVYFVDAGNQRVRRVGAGGIVSTLAGGDELQPPATGRFSGVLAGGVQLQAPLGLAAAPDGSLWLTDFDRVYRIESAIRGFTGEEIAIPGDGAASVYVFDRSGRHLRTVSSTTGAVLASFQYDAQGRLAAIVDAAGLATRIEHGADGNPVAIVAPFGQRTALAVDGHGYLSSITDPAGGQVRLVSGAGGLLESLTDPLGNATSFTYDLLGRLTGETDAAQGSKTFLRSQSFDDFQVDETTAEGRTTSRSVENFVGRFSSRVSVDSRSGTSRRDAAPNGVSRMESADGTRTTVTRSSDPVWGVLSSFASVGDTETPSGLRSSFAVTQRAELADPENLLSLRSRQITTTINGRSYQAAYDAVARRLEATTPEGRRGYSLRDPVGRLLEASQSGFASLRVTYDPQGRPLSASQGTGPDERRSSLAYDPNGFLAQVTDPAGRISSFSHDAVGRVLQQTLPGGRILGFSYDASGNVTSVLPPGRSGHSFTFTPVDLPASYKPPTLGGPLAPDTTYSYDRDRRLVTLHLPGSRTVQLTWAAGGNLAALDYSFGRVAYTYSAQALGQATAISAPGGIGLAFDNDGFLPIRTTWSGPVAGTVEWSYDADFRVIDLRIAGESFGYEYDRDGLPLRAGDLTMQRDPESGLLTATSLGSVSTTQSYNAFGELAEMSASFAGSPVYEASYERDKLGRIAARVETVLGAASTLEYGYDPAGRLSTVVRDGLPVSTLSYDDNSNRTSRVTPQGETAATHDGQDRLLSNGDKAYTYTDNGELKTKTQNGHTVRYDYDELGNLRQVVLDDGTTIDYLIDGQNRRIGKRINGSQGQGFLYQSELAPAAELDATGAVVSRFVYGSRANVPDYLVKSGRTYRILSDHLGSPRLVIDTQNGTITQRLDYDEWGKVTFDSNPGFQPFGFAGGLYDSQTGLVRFGARDYDPEVGRWTAKDPIGFEGGDSNVYGYVHEDPLNLVDPSGRYSGVDDAAFLLGGAAVGLLGQGFADLISGNLSGWEDYAASAIGGAAGGEVLLYAGPAAAGAVGGFFGNVARQSFKNATGKQCGADAESLILDTGIGALTGGIAGSLRPGITTGQNSFNAIYKSMVTKFQNGTISRVSAGTAAKMFIGRAEATGLLPGTILGAGLGVGRGALADSPACGCDQ